MNKVLLSLCALCAVNSLILSADSVLIDWGNGVGKYNESGNRGGPFDRSGGAGFIATYGITGTDHEEYIGSAFNENFGWQVFNGSLGFDASAVSPTDHLTLTMEGVAPTTAPIMAVQFFDNESQPVIRYQFELIGLSDSGFMTFASTTNIGNPSNGNAIDFTTVYDHWQLLDLAPGEGGSSTGTAWNIRVDNLSVTSATIPESSSSGLLLGILASSLVVLQSQRHSRK